MASTNEELIEAARMLQENCANLHKSGGCPKCKFAVWSDKAAGVGLCALSRTPSFWQLPKPRRWTDADIQLAKALKAFGVKFVARQVDSYACDARSSKSSGDFICSLPESSFASIQGYETVSIDDILKEEGEASSK